MRMRVLGAVAVVLVAAGCSGPAGVQTTIGEPIDPNEAFTSEAQEYCQSSGGEVQQRVPTYGTNNDQSAWVALGEPISTCKLATLDDGTAIFVDLTTLYSKQPTLAALAYLQSSTPKNLKPSGNPASAICAALGGTSEFGAGANGGGLADTDDADFPVFAPCTFADGSWIEQWGITYHQQGTIRGADLAPLFKFDAATAPQVFG